MSTGKKNPLFVLVPSPRFPNAQLLSILGVLHVLYLPLSVRETNGGLHKLQTIGIHLSTDGMLLDFKLMYIFFFSFKGSFKLIFKHT